MLSCSIWFSAPSFWMGGGLESRCVGRVYGADGAVRPRSWRRVGNFLLGVRSITDTRLLSIGSKTLLRNAELTHVFLVGLTSTSYRHVTTLLTDTSVFTVIIFKSFRCCTIQIWRHASTFCSQWAEKHPTHSRVYKRSNHSTVRFLKDVDILVINKR